MLKSIITINLLISFNISLLFINYNSSSASTTGRGLIGGNFELLNLKGKIVRSSDFKGKYLLVFFGFTHCPNVCPLGVRTIMTVYSDLKKHKKMIIPIFITIDPEVDTPKRLKEFKSRFGKELLTLRGTNEQTNDVVTKYRGYYSKNSKTSIDHSSIIYFMGTKGEYLSHFTSNQGSTFILSEIVKTITSEKS